MSFTPAAENDDTLTATIAMPATQSIFIGGHILIPTGTSLGSVEAWAALSHASGNWRAYVQSARTYISQYRFPTVQQRNGATVAFDTWTFVGAYFGPNDGSSHDHTSYTDSSVNNDASEGTDNISGNFTSFKCGGDFENNNDFTASPYDIAEVFIVSNINKTDADALAVEAQTKKPNTFATATPDHYWPLLSDATASIGGVNLTSSGSPSFDSGEHPSLSGGGSSLVSPIIML